MRVHSVAGELRSPAPLRRPPYRAPHHTVSPVGLAGGGSPLRPGEISLAHRGVLFLDELPEFQRRALEVLRQPLEEGEVRLARASGVLSLPARFQLVAAMNACPCGLRGDPRRECSCDDHSVARYRARVSGPLLDRIDLRVFVSPLSWREIGSPPGEVASSASVRARVAQARALQARRRPGRENSANADLPAAPRVAAGPPEPGRPGTAGPGGGPAGAVDARGRPRAAGGPQRRRPVRPARSGAAGAVRGALLPGVSARLSGVRSDAAAGRGG